MTTLHLFPDTNLFIQCRPLREIEWSKYSDFDHVEIIVCRAVQREIDRLKDGPNRRPNRRARKTASMLRAVLDNGPMEICASSPRVSLALGAATVPHPALSEQLDYNEVDDQVVGYAALYEENNRGVDVRVLTGDTGMMFTARQVGIAYEPLEDAWRLLPERDDRDREIEQLNREVATLRAKEPQFEIRCDDSDGPGIYRIEYDVFSPMEQSAVDEFIEHVNLWNPPTVRMSHHLTGLLSLVPEQAITRYEKRDHPSWIDEWQSLATNDLHHYLQEDGMPEITFTIRNVGTVPAREAKVHIKAEGSLLLTPSTAKLHHVEAFPRRKHPVAPPLPQPVLGVTDAIYGTYHDEFVLPEIYTPPPHDKEAFYYAERISSTPVESISLTCDLWRHAVDAEGFTIRIVPSTTDEEITGVVICRLHADNLAEPAEVKVVVKLSPKHTPVSADHAWRYFMACE